MGEIHLRELALKLAPGLGTLYVIGMSLILLRDCFLQPRSAYFFVTIDKYQFTHQSSVSYKCRFSCADSFSLAN